MAQAWRCAGLRWPADGPVLMWDGGRRSPLTWGKRVAFGVAEGSARTCVGARGHACPLAAEVPGRGTGARCEVCARLDRAHSVAADTLADDPRPYRVYLAWFGPGTAKVGITAVRRGRARLLEQGAVCFTWLGSGPLMAARRTEELLRAALRVPDRIPYADKRAARAALPATAAERAVEIASLHARARALGGWPESLTPAPFEPVDHVGVFGLTGVPAAVGQVRELVPGGAVSGELVAAAGPDLHLLTDSGVVVLDTRLLAGWGLVPVTGRESAVPVGPLKERPAEQDGLF
ncbi:DUF2797 domain-containing protein [Streptomyces griseoflavus]|uniref:DUF2797 domain-containing protein n=1 Tax=Streptomyces griseoflavus TaxID=35619 RepID=UPI00167E8A78|nr:DUF2797 domain-containing protein [Streptomyces griseoflavus]